MMRNEQEPTLDELGRETHPAFGMISASRVSQGGEGQALFDSEILHNHYVVLKIKKATRKRDLQRDWIHESKELIEVAMSEAQWASFVSSMNTSGTPCTIQRTESDWQIPGLPFAPRLALSFDETRSAAERMFTKAKEALAAYKETKSQKNLRVLEIALENSAPNVAFATESLAEHVEDTVQKARADIEAMVVSKAKELGIDPSELGRLEITP